MRLPSRLNLTDVAFADTNGAMTKFGQWMRSQPNPVINVARRFGVQRAAIYKWISGSRMPSATNCTAIEEITDGEVTVTDLLADHQAFRRREKRAAGRS